MYGVSWNTVGHSADADQSPALLDGSHEDIEVVYPQALATRAAFISTP